MNPFEKFLNQKVNESNDFDFQSLQMVVYQKGRKKALLRWGPDYTYFDIASLTKIVFTTLWCMENYHCDPQFLKKSVTHFLPWYPHPSVKVGQLLNHTAGNSWWQPFYKEISGSLSPEQSYQQMESFCRQAPLLKQERAVYSDLDFYLLGSIMQKVEGQSLQRIWQRLFEKFYPRTQFHFNVGNQPRFKRSLYAPTEKCPWRKKVVRGEVHDENCWALKGVAPHAGLFGRIEDLASYGQLLRQISLGQVSTIAAKDLQKFAKRSLPKARGDWGYGYMKPSGAKSSAGVYFSADSFGHTGFTGTSFWMDPTRELFVALLSNRVHPTRENKGFQRLRPQLHNWTVEFLEDKK